MISISAPTLLQLPRRVRLDDARQVLDRLEAAIGGAPTKGAIELDASALVDFDSAALAVLLACLRKANKSGRDMKVVGAPTKLTELARVYGLADVLQPTQALDV